jgi:uncharacterized membrane protein YedE/YeeE
MMAAIIALTSGVLFALGLVISGMTDPKIVIGFLDIFGNWNYSLAFVMAGAVMVNLISFRWILSKSKPLCETKHYLPTNKLLDKSLIIGSALFGIGWGWTGICPGPGLVNLASLEVNAIVFVLSLVLGMEVFRWFDKKRA